MATSMVFRNGNAFDGTRHRPGCGVLVHDGRIVAVGADSDLADRMGNATEVDLAGGLVMPGFQDAHVHPVQGGLERIRCDLSALRTRDEYLAAVREYESAHPDRPWIGGGGWGIPAFGPSGPRAADLDPIVPDRPVVLANRDHHGVWVNSRALELAGIDEATPDPVDGRLERDERGRPTGMLHEGAMSLVEPLIPATTDEEYLQALLEAQAHLHALGVTAWQDALLGRYVSLDDPSPTYARAVESQQLTARVRGALWWERDRGLEQVEELVERRHAASRGRFRADAVKIMLDGIVENYTAALSSPYLDGSGRATSNEGISFVEPALLREAVVRLDEEDFQVHVHAIGDRAVTEALDAFEAARRANGRSKQRHHIAHVQLIRPEDRARFAALQVTANIQALWAQYDEQMTDLTLPYLTTEVASWQYPFADVLRTGGRLAAGSDWPVSSPDPLLGMHVAVNRMAYGVGGRAGSEPLLPEQALTLDQAMAAYTSGSAFVNHLDDTGSLAPGTRADLAVLDRDPFAHDRSEIGRTSVVATYVDGDTVFST